MQTEQVNPTVSPAQLARSAHRNTALSAIVPQLRAIHARRKAEGLDKRMDGPMTMEEFRKHCTPISSRYFVRTVSHDGEGPDAFYVAVMDAEYSGSVFTAWIDPVRPGKYLGGAVHVMSWRRGEWESAVFA